jgi:hypothetical protein
VKPLFELAIMAAVRLRVGVALNGIDTRFEFSHRTVRHMVQASAELFRETDLIGNSDRHRDWRPPSCNARYLGRTSDDELAALDLARRVAEYDGGASMARASSRLLGRLRAAARRGDILRAEADVEALLEAYEFAARAGPRPRVSLEVAVALELVLKGPSLLRMRYRRRVGAAKRLLEPHCLPMGAYRYFT